MSVVYIPNRHQSITREEAFSKIGRSALSCDNDQSIDVATRVRVDCDGWYLWMSFYEDTLAYVIIYGYQSGEPDEWADNVLGIELICEDSSEFPYHEFPVDTKVVKPTYVSGNWCGYVNDGWVYLYNSATDTHYVTITTKVTDQFDFEEWVEECSDEL